MTAFADFAAWRAALVADPLDRLDRLLRSADSISPFERGRPADAAKRALESGDAETRTLADRTLAQWIAARWGDDDAVVARRGANAYFTQLNEGLTLAAWLPGPETGALLRGRREDLRQWARLRSVGEGAGDLEVTLMLALGCNQADGTLRPLWLDLCDQAGRRREAEVADLWFTVALQGLRRMPRAADQVVPTADLAEALARWAMGLGPAEEGRFHLEWRALQQAHPRKPELWAAQARRLLPRCALRPFARWWEEDLGLERTTNAFTPSRAQTDSVLKQLDRAADEAAAEAVVAPFYRAHLAYARGTGDWGAFPVALDKTGRRLHKRKFPRLAARLARLVLEHCPTTGPTWVLLAEALEELGLAEAAEAVLLDSLRELPLHAHSHTALATLLQRQGRYAEAEARCRRAVELFPDDAACAVGLGHLLAEAGAAHWPEAESCYRRAIKLEPDSGHALLGLGLLLIKRGTLPEVEPLIMRLEVLGRTEAITLRAAYRGALGEIPPKPAKVKESSPEQAPGPEWSGVLAVGKALRADFLLREMLPRKDLKLVDAAGRRDLEQTARELLAQARHDAPHHPVVALIGRRYDGHAPGPVDEAELVAGRDFGLRLVRARDARRPDALDWLEEDFPGAAEQLLIDLARLELGEEESDIIIRVGEALAADPSAAEPPVVAFARREMQARLPERAWDGPEQFVEVWDEGHVAPTALSALIDVMQLALAVPSLPPLLDDFAGDELVSA